jgi:spoIIIJ-associated protein
MADFDKLVIQILSLLTFTDVQVDLKESEAEVSLVLTVPEDASGILIGFHGEKIDALQLLFSLIYNQGRDVYLPVRLDINGYRERRSLGLIELSDNAATQALQSGREIILPPLSASERRLVHMHLGERTDVATYSEGEGRNRRLIVRPNKT